MKRILLITVLLVLAIGLSAEVPSIGEYDGFDWVKWTDTQKIQFILGYWSALKCMEEINLNNNKNENHTCATKIEGYVRITKFFRIEGTIGDCVHEIDRFYSTYSKRTAKLWFATAAAVRGDWFINWKY